MGFALLVAPGKVVTCAHVVADSMGEEMTLRTAPERCRVRLDFPFVAPGRHLQKYKLVARINTGHADSIYTVAFSSRGSVVATGAYDPTPRLFNARTHLPIGAPLEGHTGGVTKMAFSPDGRTLVTVSMDKTMRLWDVDTWQPIGPPITAHVGGISDLSFRLDGKVFATGGLDGLVRFWGVTPTADLAAQMCRIAGRPLTDAEWRRYNTSQEVPAVCR
ncbi:WD40 repeat domain-containing protein [Actinomadura sp. 9N407]|uniref:WD40 repeat domain-containing protein n=1 Tax=Actinomadura sp. 9N407 TaxID=3375154 RepID=UPI0037A24083